MSDKREVKRSKYLFQKPIFIYLLSISKRSLNPEVLNFHYREDQSNKVNGFSNLFQWRKLDVKDHSFAFTVYFLLCNCLTTLPEQFLKFIKFLLVIYFVIYLCLWHFSSKKSVPRLFQKSRRGKQGLLCASLYIVVTVKKTLLSQWFILFTWLP